MVWVGNLIMVAFLTWISIKIDSDKAIGLFLFYYIIILLLNILLFIFLSIIRSPHAGIYKITIGALLILLIPLAALVGFW